MSLEPAFGAIFGYLILGQILSAQQVVGILAVMVASVGAVYLTTVRKTGVADYPILPVDAAAIRND